MKNHTKNYFLQKNEKKYGLAVGDNNPAEIAQMGIFTQINSQNAYSGVLFCYYALIFLIFLCFFKFFP
jgi:hypothetical protein